MLGRRSDGGSKVGVLFKVLVWECRASVGEVGDLFIWIFFFCIGRTG